jgi:hypothetical protein
MHLNCQENVNIFRYFEYVCKVLVFKSQFYVTYNVVDPNPKESEKKFVIGFGYGLGSRYC